MITTAAILAAGWGSRLKELTEYMPKGLVKVGGVPLLDRSVRLLKGAGMKRIVIGTGYWASMVEDYFAGDGVVQCVRVDRYRDVQSMYTLAGLRSILTDDFILLEGDVLYEPRALREILGSRQPDVILSSDLTQANDSVFIETDPAGHVQRMSKNKSDLRNAEHELVGISRISRSTYQWMCEYFERQSGFHADMYYEEGLVEAAAHRPITVHRVDGLIWCEIDNQEHLERAAVEIWPRLKSQEAVHATAA
ncbi:MAG TPA: phosphocholine cytidylyltransferase family protein [Candidatus Andersenbacteria bacterium]|nr:MAG: hypothetical protein A2854_04690 [Parcubacteria group bacterium RIFCSPHIGHO2_01_FULL_56_18]HLD25506.1 phosphocholine cytidylyltransferase family protein [Candidatus Andersenbacteria bacterium]